jgi:hypothetical protein
MVLDKADKKVTYESKYIWDKENTIRIVVIK